jgi:hypothetical protein
MKSEGRKKATNGVRPKRPAANPAGPRHIRRGRSDDANAFMPDPEDGPARIADDLAENLAEEYLQAATIGNEVVEDDLDAVVPEEIGGPFVETSAADEFAHDTDDANPLDAEREPLPRPISGLVQPDMEAAEAEAEEEELEDRNARR